MAAPNINTYTNEYKFGRGRLLFNPLTDGIYQGFRPFGNTPGFTLSVETEKVEHYSSEGGIGEKDLDITTRINRTGEITCDNISKDNLELFLAGEQVTITQTSSPVTDEILASVTANRTYQLGATTSNPTGVRNIGSVAVRIKEGDDAPDRVNSATYAAGDTYVPATPNSHWYLCTVGGAAAGSPPTFNVAGSTHTDGAATFQDMGLIIVASTADVNYRVDTSYGLLSVTPAGTIAVANALWTATTGEKLSLHVDYTPVAGSRTQVKTSASAELSGQVKFLADNPTGSNDDCFLPSVTLAPSGAIPFITENEVAVMTFGVGINILNSTTAAIYIDGQAVNA